MVVKNAINFNAFVISRRYCLSTIFTDFANGCTAAQMWLMAGNNPQMSSESKAAKVFFVFVGGEPRSELNHHYFHNCKK